MTSIGHLGVDDWAWCRGQAYGTIRVDLDLHHVIDLIPDRTAESFAAWLRQHTEIVTILRDRGGLYAEGAAREAPQVSRSLIASTSSSTSRRRWSGYWNSTAGN